MSPALGSLNRTAYNSAVTISRIGFALAMIVLAPFSEINGRMPVLSRGLLFTGILVLEWHGLHKNEANMREKFLPSPAEALMCSQGLLVARFLQGMGGCTYICSSNVKYKL
jgi:MFS family permease